ncbi:MAG TPA: cytochrome c oxidase subunit 3 [Polyangia bacterium]|jgi:heme/copper-type cytochrome/quinol oxidase subunit 3
MSGAGARGTVTDHTRVLVIAFVASEATFFAFLILAYLYFGAQVTRVAAHELSVGRMALFSGLLWASSLTLLLAERALRRERRRGFGVALGATVALGVAFLAGEAGEWAELIHRGATVSRDLFGTTFFTLTGVHGLHVAVGLVVLVVAGGLARVAAGRGAGAPSHLLGAAAIYWHFVDVVWLVIYPVVYLGSLGAR